MADVPSLQPWGTFLFWRTLDGLPKGWADVWGLPQCLHPCSPPLFPKADPRESPGSPAVAWNCFLQDGGGTGPAAVVLVFGQLQAVPIPVPHPGCPGFCHLGMMPRMGIPFPSQPPLQPLAFLLLISPSLPVPPLFADPATGLGEALIHHRAPCQLCPEVRVRKSHTTPE